MKSKRKCLICQTEFLVDARFWKDTYTHYCSHECFMEAVRMPGPLPQCGCC